MKLHFKRKSAMLPSEAFFSLKGGVFCSLLAFLKNYKAEIFPIFGHYKYPDSVISFLLLNNFSSGNQQPSLYTHQDSQECLAVHCWEKPPAMSSCDIILQTMSDGYAPVFEPTRHGGTMVDFINILDYFCFISHKITAWLLLATVGFLY